MGVHLLLSNKNRKKERKKERKREKKKESIIEGLRTQKSPLHVLLREYQHLELI